jgi:hypothetical protein
MSDSKRRNMESNAPLSAQDKEMLQAHLEALIVTMDRLAVKDISVAALNETKNGARVTLLPFEK